MYLKDYTIYRHFNRTVWAMIYFLWVLNEASYSMSYIFQYGGRPPSW